MIAIVINSNKITFFSIFVYAIQRLRVPVFPLQRIIETFISLHHEGVNLQRTVENMGKKVNSFKHLNIHCIFFFFFFYLLYVDRRFGRAVSCVRLGAEWKRISPAGGSGLDE